MSHRRSIFVLLLAALVVAVSGRPAAAVPASAADAAAAPPPTSRPNIVFVLADDMGLGDVSCYGGTLVPTPRLDRLAQEGARFTRYYTASPICSPSRAALVTGQYPARWRINSYLQAKAGNRGVGQADFLDPAAPSLPRQLKAAGYGTAHVGKWHLGGGRDVTEAPKFAAYGYDEHAGTYESPEPHPDVTATNWIWSPKDKVKRWDRSAFFVDKTIDFVRRQNEAGRPAFVNLWLDDPHTPWVPAEGAPKGDTPANLKGVLADLDRQVGRLVDGLKAIGADGSTLLIFTSDNGPLPTFQAARSAGLRGAKLGLYEAGIRVPFIARWPGRVPAGRVDEQTVLSALDLFPTLCAVAGAKLPDGYAGDGQEMSAALLAGPAGEAIGNTAGGDRKAPLFWEYGRNDQFYAYPKNQRDRSPTLAVRDGRWKLLVNADGSGAELYDVTADPAEKEDMAATNPDAAKRLTDQVLAWRRAMPG